MTNYRNLKSISLGQSESDSLKGAISAGSEIPFLRNYSHSTFGFEAMPDCKSVGVFAEESFKHDYDNDIFVDENGAVANAYVLPCNMPDEEESEAIKNIVEEENQKHPEYAYEMKKGQFPIDIVGGTSYSNGSYTADTPVMSTHILYITNYKEFLKSKTRIR